MAEQARRYAGRCRLAARAARSLSSRSPCPACARRRAAPAVAQVRPRLPRCSDCGTVYMSPRPTRSSRRVLPALGELRVLEPRRLPGLRGGAAREDLPAARRARRRDREPARRADGARVARRRGRLRHVLRGGRASSARFERVVALEPEPHLAETCRGKGLEVIEAPVEQASCRSRGVDVVTSFEVIEHLFSPREFIDRCAERAPTGRPASSSPART